LIGIEEAGVSDAGFFVSAISRKPFAWVHVG
jgi:hypothetical protein